MTEPRIRLANGKADPVKYADIHFCLVSKQPLPALIPLFMAETRPRTVLLFVSSGMAAAARRLAAIISSLGIGVDNVDDVSPYEIESIREKVMEKLAEHDGLTVALNATGGTKVMALGAYDVFRQMDKPIFYVDTDNSRLINLHPHPATVSLPPVINVKTYLRSYGYQVVAESFPSIRPDYRPLTEHLVRNVGRLAYYAIGTLNRYASQAEGSCRVALADPLKPDLRNFLDMLEEKGLLALGEREIVFRDEEARAFVNGGWLEDHVAAVALELKRDGLIHDLRKNVVVESGGGTRNELDLAFTAHNKLHLVECKTKNFARLNRADDVAYKLDTLTDLMGGTFGKAMLITYRRVGDSDLKRCAESGIEVVQGGRINNLKKILVDWIGGR